MSEQQDIQLFTSSEDEQAISIKNYLDPKKKYISGIFSRKSCIVTKNGFFLKDLRIFKNIDLSKIIIVDNLSHSFGMQIENGIPILEWSGEESDQELKFLIDYLVEASKEEDIRQYNMKKLRLLELSLYSEDDL